MYCSTCGAKMPDHAVFCSVCGARLNAVNPQGAGSQPYQQQPNQQPYTYAQPQQHFYRPVIVNEKLSAAVKNTFSNPFVLLIAIILMLCVTLSFAQFIILGNLISPSETDAVISVFSNILDFVMVICFLSSVPMLINGIGGFTAFAKAKNEGSKAVGGIGCLKAGLIVKLIVSFLAVTFAFVQTVDTFEYLEQFGFDFFKSEAMLFTGIISGVVTLAYISEIISLFSLSGFYSNAKSIFNGKVQKIQGTAFIGVMKIITGVLIFVILASTVTFCLINGESLRIFAPLLCVLVFDCFIQIFIAILCFNFSKNA